MATITTRKRADGTTAYLVQIVKKSKGQVVRENRTFDNKRAAVAFGKQRETELDKPGAIAAALKPATTLAAAIDTATVGHVGKTKAQCLRTIKAMPIADMNCADITTADIMALAGAIADKGAGPSTVMNYLSHLQSVFTYGDMSGQHKLNPQEMRKALFALRKTDRIAKSSKRERRPSREELDQLIGHFTERAKRVPHAAPMVEIVVFAMFSTRRLEEITRIRWADLEQPHDGALGRVLVRDMKNPGQKRGNNVWCDLPPEALAVAIGMPRTAERIFPYAVDGIGAAFTRACRVLGIEDLHFHDLRHEGVSRLFELGWNIPQVATVSGHRSWDSLKRYAQMRKTGDKWAGWDWRQPHG